MKSSFLLTAVFLLGSFLFSNAQQFSGTDADRLIRGSEVVRLSEHTATPSYVRFHENHRFPAAKFSGWARKAFDLSDNIGLELDRIQHDEGGLEHHRYRITANGIPVFGAFCHVHVLHDMAVSVNGKMPDRIAPQQANISESAALEKAKLHMGASVYKWELPEEEEHLKWETGNAEATYFPKGELLYIHPQFDLSDPNGFRPAYRFDMYAHEPMDRKEVFVDAQTGEVIFINDRICSVDVPGTAQTGHSGQQPIIADSFNGGYRLREDGRGGGIRTFDMNTGTTYGNAVDFTDSDNFWDNANPQLDQYATDAHWGAEVTYDYFLDHHGRNSIDGNGMTINSYVHYDQDYFNAFWDGQRMTYGDGTNSPLTALDICGHEMTHGVTDFSADLIYQDEYGALNESFSDIFGAAVEFVANPSSGDWLIGEDVGTFRSMINPNQYGDPDTYNGTNWYTGTDDNGGVHINSGVQNKWFQILVDGESGTNNLGNAYSVSGIGLEAAAAIAYRNLTVYLGPTSEYADARFFSIQSAIDLFGGCSPEVIATTDAWYAVGVGSSFDPTVTADFSVSATSGCESPLNVAFTNLTTNGETFEWNFGDGNTSNDASPSHTYTANGLYSVSLTVDGGNCGTDTMMLPDLISVDPDNPCVARMPEDGSQTLTWCAGTLYDDGGPNSNYQDENSVVTTIAPPGANSVTINFQSFAFEENYDYLYIYDGPNTTSPLIGQYDGFNLPEGGTITSSGGAITLRQFSDIYVNEAGFKLTWTCAQPNAPPTADFVPSLTVSCNGEVSFSDRSVNGATDWFWDFGDGNTSSDQNPTHTYLSEGTYTVVLTASNGFGQDAVSYHNLIVVDRPEGPAANGGFSCSPASFDLSASGSGDLRWYDQPSGGTPIGTGATFNTPFVPATTSYFVEEHTPAAVSNVGPTDNGFGDGGNFAGNQHQLFDAFVPFILRSVNVYAEGGGERTIQLRDSNGNVLHSLTTDLSNGQQTVELNFPIQPGTNLQLGTTPGPDLYRNSSGPSYPYTLPGVMSITSSSAGNDYYYFFYDWEVEIPGCTTERTEVIAEVADIPVAQNMERCGSGTVDLTANGSGNLSWYDAETGGNLLGTGSTFTTPVISSSTSFFVESEIVPTAQQVGPTTNNFGGGGNFNNIQSLVFDCFEEVTLESVRVYAQGSGNRTIELRSNAGTVIESATVNVPDGESVVPLGFTLPIGTDLQLGTSAGPDLFRNNAGSNYPYELPGVLSITGSTAGPDYYYFFYDWVIQRPGCTTARTEVLASVGQAPTISAAGPSSICAGETIQLNATIANASDAIWSDGQIGTQVSVSPTETETFSVSTNNDCGSVNDSVTVEVIPLPTLATSGNMSLCDGETVVLSASSNVPVVWEPTTETADDISVSPTTTSTYTAIAENNCGTVSEDVEVTVHPLPATPVITTNGTQLTTGPGTSYQWFLNGELINGADSDILVPTETGDYTAQVTDANGCSAVSEPFNWMTVGLSETSEEPGFQIFPNPAHSDVRIESVAKMDLVELLDARGKLILSERPADRFHTLRVSALAKGMYQVRIQTRDGWKTARLIKH